VADQFVDGRVGDRIGLTVFAGAAYTQCPLTLDYGVLKQLIGAIDFGTPDGTAIGMAIANSVNRLRKSTARSKVIILLTDGRNNAGEIDPVTPRALRIKIYTIGVGVGRPTTRWTIRSSAGATWMASDVDDDPIVEEDRRPDRRTLLPATSAEALKEIYARIDRLEKTKVESREYVDYNDLGPRYLAWAAGLLALTVSAGALGLRRRP
jgi:Ca-activated chloride channel family protein